MSDSLRPHELQHARPPVHHHLLEFTQTHIHRASDAIQPSHPLSSPSPPAPNPSQHQSLFQWVNSSHEVAKVLEFQLQHHSFQRNPRDDLLQNGLVGSPSCPILCDSVDCSLPGSSIREILQARIQEWIAISSSRGSSQCREWTRISYAYLH